MTIQWVASLVVFSNTDGPGNYPIILTVLFVSPAFEELGPQLAIVATIEG